MAKRFSDSPEDKRCLVRMNKVAPVIIKDCREEFQHISDLKDTVIRGSAGDNMPEHPLIKGSCFLVSEVSQSVDTLHTLKTLKTPNFHRVSDLPVYASGQPSAGGLNAVLNKLTTDGHKVIFVFSLRQEPVLFLRSQEDFIPHSLRHREKLRRLYFSDLSPVQADENEAAIRKETLDLALLDENHGFYVYHESGSDGDTVTLEPRLVTLTVEDQLLTSTELCCSHTFAKTNLKYYRLGFPRNRAPSDETVDEFSFSIEDPRVFVEAKFAFPALYFVCGTGKTRSTLAKTMACLLDHDTNNHNADIRRLKAVQLMVSHIDNGYISGLGGESVLAVSESDRMYPRRQSQAGCHSHHSQQQQHERPEGSPVPTVPEIHRKILLFIMFQCLPSRTGQPEVVHPLHPVKHHPGLVSVLCNLDLSKHTEPASLVTSGQRCLVADNYIGLDVLSSRMDVKVANFRRLMGLPVYGMAQPARDGLSRVVNFLLHKKQGCSQVVIVNLRNDVAIEFDETTYHVEDVGNLGEPVLIYGASDKEMEVCEEALLKEFKGKKSITVYEELSSPAVSKTFCSALTPNDLWQQQRLQTLDMSYVRLPIQYDHGFQEKIVHHRRSGVRRHPAAVFCYLTSDTAWKEDNYAFVFHCRTGKSRSSLAMAVAGLLFYHIREFPYGSKPGEQELVSCPNRSYTLGEFEVVMRLIRRLPQGYQRKREVDFVLDRLFETMSPMHFHLREVIFVTYNKIKSATSELDRQELRRQSVDLLERYIYLILFNTYLAHEKGNHFQMPFSQWMQEVASEAGAYDILDNLCFTGLESPPNLQFSSRHERWSARHPAVPFYGEYV
ncbi:paladin-like [Pomacea canaliculata]|uniref:paladin-like n=1 Tax=Pomacea canaliculata TaxID=400727 RepID=UPI000D734A06|nr:paladin-like [Pomacea canaliculata]